MALLKNQNQNQTKPDTDPGEPADAGGWGGMLTQGWWDCKLF